MTLESQEINFIIYLNAKHFLWNENYIYKNMPSILEKHKLFNSRDVKILLKLVKFINIINAKFA